MTSRTPIRLTPHRGPLATPSASPESSPTSSTPPTDISRFSAAIGLPSLDLAILQHRISTLNPPTGDHYQSRLHRRRGTITEWEPFGRSTELSPTLDRLFYSVCELANTLAGIVALCLLIWSILEWSSHASELYRQPNPWLSMPPLPHLARALPSHVNLLLREPSDQHVAVLQFLSEQIQHAKALSSLSLGLGLPLRAFLEAHRSAIPNRLDLPGLPHPFHEVDSLANLTELLDTSLLDFTPGSFIGRNFVLALDELGDLVSKPALSYGSMTYGEYQDGHLHAIYWRTTSNLLLEYSAARPRARKLLQYVRALHQELSPIALSQRTAERIVERSNVWRWKSMTGHYATNDEDGMQAFVTGLETTLGNVHRLIAYLDWITEHLAQTSLRDVLKRRHGIDFSSCLGSLQELFAQSKPSPPKRRFCLNDHGVTSPPFPLEKVDITVPGSPTVRAGR